MSPGKRQSAAVRCAWRAGGVAGVAAPTLRRAVHARSCGAPGDAERAAASAAGGRQERSDAANGSGARSTNVGDTLPSGQLSNVPWRRTGVRYTNNEAYFDVIEEVDAIIDRSGE
ncbi:unnamed protein product [Lampetra fluviatilis]